MRSALAGKNSVEHDPAVQRRTANALDGLLRAFAQRQHAAFKLLIAEALDDVIHYGNRLDAACIKAIAQSSFAAFVELCQGNSGRGVAMHRRRSPKIVCRYSPAG